MKLKDYLKKNKIRKEKFASDVGCAISTLHNWCGGVFRPHPLYIKVIEELTHGKVTAEDFL